MTERWVPGDVGITPVSGWVGVGIRLGERWLDGHGADQHAFVVVDSTGLIVEAEPGGARLGHATNYPHAVYSSAYGINPPDDERRLIVTEALHLLGTPYSYLDYVALALYRADRDSPLTEWAQRRVESSRHMICSQLAATAQYAAPSLRGLYGPNPQNVTPGDMRNVWEHHGG